jgi:exportin-T
LTFLIGNQPAFETLIATIEHFTKDVDDYPSAKMAFSVLSRMVVSWGGPDIAGGTSDGTRDTESSSVLPGFDRFMMERFSPLCWSLAGNPKFEPKDPQGKQVLGEAAGLQRAIYSKTGETYLGWLRDTELKSMGMDAATIDDYLNALTSFDMKQFRRYFQVGEPPPQTAKLAHHQPDWKAQALVQRSHR